MSSVSGQCDLTYTSVDPLCNGVCDGQATLFPTGSAPFSYSWSTGDNTETVDSLCAGTYTVTMIDDLGCSASVSITITEPAIPFTVDAYLISNSSVSGPCEGQIGWTTSGGQPDYTINWYDCNTMDLYTNLPYFCAGEYFSVFMDDYGCIDTSECVTVNDNVIGLSEMFNSNPIQVYPNPASEIITLEMAGSDFTELFIYDYDGRVFLYQNNYSEVINISGLASGNYVLRVVANSCVHLVKISKL